MERGGRRKGHKGPWLWPLILVAIGAALLLHNFLLLGDFNVANLWPLLLVLLGAQILLRGDFYPDAEGRTFGITRGSVETAVLEIYPGEIDLNIRGLRGENQERLIAGQYAAQSRPSLRVSGVHAHLILNRAHTPWHAFGDWELGLARDLPWQIYISAYLGQIRLDLSDLVIQGGVISSGIGDIMVTSPFECFEELRLHATLGSVHWITPPEYRTRIHVEKSRFFGLHVDSARYLESEPGIYESLNANEEAPLVNVMISGGFGEAHLI